MVKNGANIVTDDVLSGVVDFTDGISDVSSVASTSPKNAPTISPVFDNTADAVTLYMY